MSTLVHVSSERPQKDSVSWSRVAESTSLIFYWYQRYWKCLQWIKSRRRSTYLRVEHASIRTSLYCQSWYSQRSQVSRDTILLWILPPYPDVRTGERCRTRWTRSSLFGIDILCCSLIKSCLILLTHLANSHPLYMLILHIPIDHCILSLITIMNSW